MSKLKLYSIDDGEHHGIAALSEDDARQAYIKHYDGDPEYIESIAEIDKEEHIKISFPDGLTKEEMDDLPGTLLHHNDSPPYCVATVEAWLAKAELHDLVFTTCC